MTKSTAAEATRQQQFKLAWAEHWIYRKLFKWYAGAYLKAKSPRPPWNPPAFEPAMRKIIARANAEWTELTGLPAMDACDPTTWWTAAIAAGREGQPVPNVRVLSSRALVEIILPWALALPAATEQTAAGAQAKPTESADIGSEERALALLLKHPEWSQQAMAEAVGVNRTTLYRFERYQAARGALQGGKADIPRGSKDKNGHFEAWECDTFCDTDD